MFEGRQYNPEENESEQLQMMERGEGSGIEREGWHCRIPYKDFLWDLIECAHIRKLKDDPQKIIYDEKFKKCILKLLRKYSTEEDELNNNNDVDKYTRQVSCGVKNLKDIDDEFLRQLEEIILEIFPSRRRRRRTRRRPPPGLPKNNNGRIPIPHGIPTVLPR